MTHTAAYIAPCVFWINEKEHFTISDSDMNDLRIIYFTPTTVNGSLNFDNVGALMHYKI